MSNNVVWHSHPVDRKTRAEQKSQEPLVIWFTGLSASGKSTIAGALEQILMY
jgi:adenylylsulfate kinase